MTNANIKAHILNCIDQFMRARGNSVDLETDILAYLEGLENLKYSNLQEIESLVADVVKSFDNEEETKSLIRLRQVIEAMI